jgi:prephenate dehydratase
MPQPHPTFDGAFQAVASGKAERGLIPFENSLAGSVHENYDRLSASPLHIIGETQLRIRQCLIARPGSTLAVIRRVGLASGCARPVPEVLRGASGSRGHRDLRHRGQRDGPAARRSRDPGAIGPALAASLYGGQILMESIEDDPENYTRFLLLAREAVQADKASKTSIVFTTKNVPGALHQAPRRLRQPRRGPGQDRVAAFEGPALGVFVLIWTCSGIRRPRSHRRSRSCEASPTTCGSWGRIPPRPASR